MSKIEDPIAFELFKNAIFAIADEMALTICRTTYSGVLRDNMDFSTAFANADGKLVANGKLTFGVALTGRPFAYRRDGQLRGFEVEFAAAVARSRGLELEIVQLPRADLGTALAAGEVDLVNSLALDQRASKGLAVLPYLTVGDHMMVLKGNPFRIRAVEDLAGHTVSTTMGLSLIHI